jgi:hypothetical protein
MAVERPRRVQVQPFPSNRRLVTAAMRAGRRMAPMYGLVDVDVTKANRLLASHERPSSLTAFVVASVARAAAAHPDVHAYRNWRGQLVTHHYCDVGTMVEISTPQGPFALPHVLRDADVRDVLQQPPRHPGSPGSADGDNRPAGATPGMMRIKMVPAAGWRRDAAAAAGEKQRRRNRLANGQFHEGRRSGEQDVGSWTGPPGAVAASP